MKTFFITYGDQNYQESLLRIKKEAEALEIFDEVRLYNDEALPEPFKDYTTQYKRGGGYWLWKPWIIHDTLSRANEGDIIVYADAGCTLLKHKDWRHYFKILKKKEAIFFIASGKNRKWCKKEVFSFFNPYNDLWKFANQIQATFIIIKKTKDNDAVEHWYHLAEKYPHLFTDVNEEDRCKESPSFKEHRHDQSVLTGCICTSKQLNQYCLLPEKMEKRYKHGQAVLASRISGNNVRGIGITAPAENALITYINDLIINPLRKITTLLFFHLSRLRKD